MNFNSLRLPKHIKKQIERSITDKQVCTRFPPEPSGGSIHLGHLFAARLNQSVANVYNGKFLVRFDDTNPISECEDYEKAIITDLLDCGFDLSNLSYTSDSFDMLIEKATELIANGYAYIDNSTQENISHQRKTLTISPYRNRTIDENLSKWVEMQTSDESYEVCLRLKAYPTSKNGAMRDPVLYRRLNMHHHRTQDRYKVYPTYDFACPILDSYDKVTHIFRSKEYCERDEQMNFILNKLEMTVPKALTYGRLNIEGAVLSKSKIKAGIAENIYSGWDDAKLFTYRGMMKKGLSLDGINKLLDDIGYPESSITIQQQKIYTINTKIIDKKAYRVIGINKDQLGLYNIIDTHSGINKTIPHFTGNEALGHKKIEVMTHLICDKREIDRLQDNEEVTLIYIGNMIYNLETNSFTLNLKGNPANTSIKLLWLNPTNTVSALVERIDGKLEEILVEDIVKTFKDGCYVQLNKRGYHYVKKTSGCITFVEMYK